MNRIASFPYSEEGEEGRKQGPGDEIQTKSCQGFDAGLGVLKQSELGAELGELTRTGLRSKGLRVRRVWRCVNSFQNTPPSLFTRLPGGRVLIENLGGL